MIDEERIIKHFDAVAPIVARYKAGDRAGARIELAAISNKLYLSHDSVCPFCEGSRTLMKRVIEFLDSYEIKQKEISTSESPEDAPSEELHQKLYLTPEAQPETPKKKQKAKKVNQ